MNRRTILKAGASVLSASAIGFGVGEHYKSQPTPVENMGFVDLDDVPKGTVQDGKILTTINDEWYWINPDEPSFDRVKDTVTIAE